MKSVLHLEESVDNKDRKFGSAQEYYPVKVIAENGDEVCALFTEDQLATAIQRALRNPEDIPEDKSLWDMIFS